MPEPTLAIISREDLDKALQEFATGAFRQELERCVQETLRRELAGLRAKDSSPVVAPYAGKAPTREDSREASASARKIQLDRAVDPPVKSDPLATPRRSGVATDDVESTALLQSTAASPPVSKIARLVLHPWFERTMGLMVVANSLVLGLEAEDAVFAKENGLSYQTSKTFQIMDVCFCSVFATELYMRLSVEGKGFFDPDHDKVVWNCLDCFLVLLQVLDQLVTHVIPAVGMPSLKAARMLRLVRIVRLVRVVHLFDELQAIVTAITSSGKSMVWALLLIVTVTYMFSVFFLNSIAHADVVLMGHEQLSYWFSGLGRTMLTMFECITGGLGWDDVNSVLMTEVSPVMSAFFIAYIVLGLLAIMNIVTGIFVETVIQTALEDRDNILAMRLAQVFTGGDDPDTSSQTKIDRLTFINKMSSKDAVSYFKALEMDPSDGSASEKLFELLDKDGSGTVDTKEIISGCLGLKGMAKVLDIENVAHQVRSMGHELQSLNGRLSGMESRIPQPTNASASSAS